MSSLARPRSLHRLNHLRIVKLKRPGIYEDGGGLRLIVGPTLKKRWVMRVTIDGRRRERGLGGFPTVSLEHARQRAAEWRTAARAGRDLAAEARRKRAARGATFEDAFRAYFAIKRRTLSNAKHVAQWESTITTYVMPQIGCLAVADIDASDVLAVLTPLWFEKPETARRVLQRVEAVFGRRSCVDSANWHRHAWGL
jgi:hypothetical protein